jgi:hypothetical protein
MKSVWIHFSTKADQRKSRVACRWYRCRATSDFLLATNHRHFCTSHRKPRHLSFAHLPNIPTHTQANSMDSRRPIDENDEDDIADYIRRTTRGGTPAPEDHSMENSEPVDDRSGESRSAYSRPAGTNDSMMGSNEQQGMGYARPSSTGFTSANDFSEDDEEQQRMWDIRRTRMDAAQFAVQEEPVTGRNIFGGRTSSALAGSEGQTYSSINQAHQQEPIPASVTQRGWSSPFSPSSRRSTEQLSRSSARAVSNPDAVVQSIGTQRLMPSRDPMAAFHAPPRPRGPSIDPRTTLSSGIGRDEELYQLGRAKPSSPWLQGPRRTGTAAVSREEQKEWDDRKAVDDLTKKMNEDRATGLMPAPAPPRPWVKPSFPPPSKESKELMSPSMRRQCDVWGKAWREEQQLKAKEKKEKGEAEKKKKRKRSPKDDPSGGGNPPPGPPRPGPPSPGNPPPGNPPPPPSGRSRSGGPRPGRFPPFNPPRRPSRRDHPVRDSPAGDSPEGQSLASGPRSEPSDPSPAGKVEDGSNDSPPQAPPTQIKQWTRPRQGHEVFSTQPWVTSSGWFTSSGNKRDWSKLSPSPPPSPKKHKSEGVSPGTAGR